MISDEELAILSEVQQLPLVSNPFTEIATRLRMDENKILAICKNMLSKGFIRRFGLSLSHRKIGILANLMVAVNVPKDRIDEVGKEVAAESRVSHCYYRTGWDYNLFFMIHSQLKEEVINLAKKILEKLSITDYRFIFSIKEFKKTSFMLPRQSNDQYE